MGSRASGSAVSKETLQLRKDLIVIINRIIQDRGWSQKQAATNLKITQPRVSDLKTSKVANFSVDSLLRYLSRLGHRLEFDTKQFRPQRVLIMVHQKLFQIGKYYICLEAERPRLKPVYGKWHFYWLGLGIIVGVGVV